MRLILLTFFGCLTCVAGHAQDAPSAQKLQRARENMTRREQRLEDAQAVRDARAARRAEADAEQKSADGSDGAARKTNPQVQSGAAKHNGAHLLMDRPTYNFGDVPRRGGDLIHDFVFTNDGTAPLVVTRVITSCSCLKAAFPKRPVAPGESGTIRITYEPHKSEPGSFNKVIQIYSNSIDNRDVITVQGNSIDGEGSVKIKGDKIKTK